MTNNTSINVSFKVLLCTGCGKLESIPVNVVSARRGWIIPKYHNYSSNPNKPDPYNHEIFCSEECMENQEKTEFVVER